MKNKKLIALIIMLTMLLSIQSIQAFASTTNNNQQKTQNQIEIDLSTSLPSSDLFKPDLNAGEAGARGFVNIMNIIVGIGGLVVLGLAGLSLIKDIVPLVRGQKTIGQMTGRLITLGGAIFALLLVLTGAWVPALYFLWDTILVRILNAFFGSGS